jgi:hypothetical protein
MHANEQFRKDSYTGIYEAVEKHRSEERKYKKALGIDEKEVIVN